MKEAALIMIVTTSPNKESRSRKRKREVEEGSPSAEAVSEASLKQTAPMILARWKTAAYKGNSTSRRLAEVIAEMEATPGSRTEEDFKPQRVKTKRGSTSGQTWEVDVGKEWISSQHHNVGGQVTSDLLEKGLTRNTFSSWWIALNTVNKLENCLKKMESGVSRKLQSWATKQKAEVNKLEMRSQLGQTWGKLL